MCQKLTDYSIILINELQPCKLSFRLPVSDNYDNALLIEE